MAVFIFHGDNTFASRQKLGDRLADLQAKKIQIKRFEAKQLTPAQLEETQGSQSLFAEPQAIVIEGVHSLPTSARKKSLLETIISLARSTQDSGDDLLIWENRILTKTMLKPFVELNATVFEAKVSSVLFRWLDLISPVKATKQNQITVLQQALEQENEFLVLTMLIRQCRLLLYAKLDQPIKAAPFVVQKIKKQASLFSLEQLYWLQGQLAQIDKNLKTSTGQLSLPQALTLLLLQL